MNTYLFLTFARMGMCVYMLRILDVHHVVSGQLGKYIYSMLYGIQMCSQAQFDSHAPYAYSLFTCKVLCTVPFLSLAQPFLVLFTYCMLVTSNDTTTACTAQVYLTAPEF